MRASKLKCVCCLLCGALFALTCAQHSRILINWGDGGPIGWDGNARRNEICLAHERINSFHVWDRTVSVKGFRPLGRPDMDDPACLPTDRVVHAYPVWHTCFFWFVGSMGNNIYVPAMYCLFGACLFFIISTAKKCFADFGTNAIWLTVGVVALLMHPISVCFFSLNYSVLILAVLLSMLIALENERPYLAGLCWALMMIKPQMAVLFFWPLLFRRQYKTITTAAVVCLGATVVMSIVYCESPIQLILQIPKIGAPYTLNTSGMVLSSCIHLFGGNVQWLWSVFCFAVCGLLSYLLKERRMLECCVPAVVFVPLWTYSQPCDYIVLMLWYVVAFRLAFSETTRQRYLWMSYVDMILLLALLTPLVWVFGHHCGLFDAKKAKLISQFQNLSMSMYTFVMLLVFVLRKMRNDVDDEIHRGEIKYS